MASHSHTQSTAGGGATASGALSATGTLDATDTLSTAGTLDGSGAPEVTGSGGAPAPPGVIGRGGFFALSFGSIVGSGWIMLLGDWLRLAAPGGALLALLAGGFLMAAVGMCYAELAARMPRAGGELRYALETLGPRVAFTVGWFLTLFLIAISAFEGTALGWLSGLLLPARHSPVLYRILGEPVTAFGLTTGCLGAVAICALNLAGLRISVLFQRMITFGFLLLMTGLIAAGLLLGDLHRLQPWFSPPGRPWWLGSSWMFATCAMLLYGFQTSLYLIEERAPGVEVRAATGGMVLGIIVAAVFYAAIILAAGSIVPWRTMLGADLPSVAAFDALHPGAGIGTVVLVVAILSLAKTWNAVSMMASRLVLAQSQAGLLPGLFSRLDPRRRTPTNAILLVSVASIIGIVLGRGALVPVINMATICVSITIFLMLIVLLVQRRRQPLSPGFSLPAARIMLPVCLSGVGLMAAFAVLQPCWLHPGFPLEWTMILLWAALGLMFRRFMMA
jgi:amino acid transporter